MGERKKGGKRKKRKERKREEKGNKRGKRKEERKEKNFHCVSILKIKATMTAMKIKLLILDK